MPKKIMRLSTTTKLGAMLKDTCMLWRPAFVDLPSIALMENVVWFLGDNPAVTSAKFSVWRFASQRRLIDADNGNMGNIFCNF